MRDLYRRHGKGELKSRTEFQCYQESSKIFENLTSEVQILNRIFRLKKSENYFKILKVG